MKPIDRGTWLPLIAMGIAVFVIANDFSAINVAIPQIEEDFNTDVTTARRRTAATVTPTARARGTARRRERFRGTAV